MRLEEIQNAVDVDIAMRDARDHTTAQLQRVIRGILDQYHEALNENVQLKATVVEQRVQLSYLQDTLVWYQDQLKEASHHASYCEDLLKEAANG